MRQHFLQSRGAQVYRIWLKTVGLVRVLRGGVGGLEQWKGGAGAAEPSEGPVG